MNKRIAVGEGVQDQGTIIRALPHDVIYKILARLPLKSLMRFKAVSKEWLHTIHDPSLATEFLIHRSQIHTAALTCLISFFRSNHYYSLDLDSGLAIPFENLNQPEFDGAKVWNTVMGLTCFEAKGITYFCNLRTREITALPHTEPDFPVNSMVRSSSSLGFDSVKGQYKILKIWTLFGKATAPSKICHKVITLGTSEWRTIDDGFPTGEFGGPIFIDGRLHYLTKDMHEKETLVAFQVGTEKFEVIEIPKKTSVCQRHLISYKDCLAFVDFKNPVNGRVMSMGVFEDQKWVVKEVELPRDWKKRGFNVCNFHVTGINTGEILLTRMVSDWQFSVYRYDMEKRSMKEIEIHGLSDDLQRGRVFVVGWPPQEYGESILSLNLH